MRHIPIKVIIIQSLVLLISIVAYSFNNAAPHQFKEEQCGFCHLNYESPLHFRDNITTLCNYCHGKRNVLSHAVGVRPSMQVPTDFHLDAEGEMTCTTCHDIHMDRVDPVSGERTYLLRSNLRGREFCDSCHANTIAMNNPQIHATSLETAHFGYYTGSSYSIDRVSVSCMGCHDGTTADGASVVTKAVHPIGDSHSIGIDYLKAYRKNQELRSSRDLSSEIKLFEGKVGCASCHNPFNLAKFKLSVTSDESKLCFECHLK